MNHRDELIQKSIPFLREVKDMTPSADMEKWLNQKYGEQSELYRSWLDLLNSALRRAGRQTRRWTARAIGAAEYWSRSPETFHFSITAVYMDSKDPKAFKDEDDDDVLRGQYHGHPYGELNMVIPLDEGRS